MVKETEKSQEFDLSASLAKFDLTRRELGLFRAEWELEQDISDEDVLNSIKRMAKGLADSPQAMEIILTTKPELGLALTKVQIKMEEAKKANSR